MIENKICYSQNVFPADGEIVERVAIIAGKFNKIRDALQVPASTPFPLGLWLDAQSAANLADSETLEKLKKVLDDNNNSVFTINAFPYGLFHSTKVKEKVYLPDWTSPERVDFTLRVADVLAELLPTGVVGSISTLPGGYRGLGEGGSETENGENRERERSTSKIQHPTLNKEGLKARNSIAQGGTLGGGGEAERPTRKARQHRIYLPRADIQHRTFNEQGLEGCNSRGIALGGRDGESERPTSNIQHRTFNEGGGKARKAEAQDIALGERLEIIASNMRRVAEHLAAILAEKGVKIILAVEMEPDCLWESPAEFIEFREEFLVGHPAAEEFIGVCYDTCHQELLGAKPGEGLKLLEKSGVPVPKIQLSAAITREIRENDDLETAFQELARFAEGVYLHQTRLIRPDSGGVLLKFKDIPSPSEIKRILEDDAFAKSISCHTEPIRLVSHFHTPIHMNKLSDGLRTAKNELSAVLKRLSERPKNELPHLEIETYTYNVLPSELREVEHHASMTNEYKWVMEHFEK